MEDLVIKNGLVVTPHDTVRGGLAIRNEKILQIGADDSLPKANLEVEVEGSFKAIFQFINKLEHSFALIRISSLTIRSQSQTSDQIRCRLSLSKIFF